MTPVRFAWNDDLTETAYRNDAGRLLVDRETANRVIAATVRDLVYVVTPADLGEQLATMALAPVVVRIDRGDMYDWSAVILPEMIEAAAEDDARDALRAGTATFDAPAGAGDAVETYRG